MKKILKPVWAKLLLIVILIGAGYFVYTKLAAPKAQAPQYQTAKAERGTLIVSVTGSGKISAANSTAVNADITGVVEEVYVKSGDTVQAGTQIARITLDEDSQQKQAQAYASYLSAKNAEKQSSITKASNQASLEQARKAVLDAAQAVMDMDARLGASQPNPSTKQTYTQNEIESIRSTLTQARQNFAVAEQKYNATDTSIASSKASLTAAWLDYKNISNIITAPVAGTITNISIQKGDTIFSNTNSNSTTSNTSSTSNNSNTTSSQKIAMIKTGSKPSITISLSEIDIPKIKIGNKVNLTADAFPDKTFTGHVTDIDTSGTVSSGVVTYPVTITSDIDDDQLYANMTVTATIITSTKDNVLLVPSSAVQRQNGEATVRILKDGQLQSVPVQTGTLSDTQVEIVSGLNEGDEVITSVTNTATSTQRTGTSVFGGGFGGGFGGNRTGGVRIQTR